MEELKNNLEKIKHLQELVPFPSLLHEVKAEAYYNGVGDKVAIAKPVIKIKDIAVMFMSVEPNGEFPSHLHESEIEIICVYSGDLKIIMSHRVIQIIDYGVITIPAGTAHTACSVRGSKLLAITIPASEGYADVK